MAKELAIQLCGPSNILSRLEEEKAILEEFFEGEKFPIIQYEDAGERCFERAMKFESGNVYRLRICIAIGLGPFGYPHYPPDLLVCDSSEPMPENVEWRGSHETHTWPRKHGLLSICYYHPACWNIDQDKRELDLRVVFIKGEEWLKAYEKHLRTGLPMNEYLPDMIATEEDQQKFAEKRMRALQTVHANLEKWVLANYSFTLNLKDPCLNSIAEFFKPQEGLNQKVLAIPGQPSNDVCARNDVNGLSGLFSDVWRALLYLNLGSHCHGPNIIIRAERIQKLTCICLTSTVLTSLGGISQEEQCDEAGRIQNAIAVLGENAHDFHKLVSNLILKVLASGVDNTGSRIKMENVRVAFTPFIPVMFG